MNGNAKIAYLLSVSSLSVALSPGCNFPALKGADICSGLRIGDRLEVQLARPSQNRPQPAVCDEALEFVSGATLVVSVGEVKPDGCGTAIGVLEGADGSPAFLIDLVKSREIGDDRFDHWVGAGRLVDGNCEGQIALTLYDVVPEVVERNEGVLSIVYDDEVGGSCPASCNMGFDVVISKKDSN